MGTVAEGGLNKTLAFIEEMRAKRANETHPFSVLTTSERAEELACDPDDPRGKKKARQLKGLTLSQKQYAKLHSF